MRIPMAVVAVVTLSAPAGAQPASQPPAPSCGVRGSQQWLSTRPSPLDSATVTVGGTIAKLCYSAPSLRGRALEDLIPEGRAWRTGANEPTTLTLTGRLDVGGAVLAPGRYVILTVPRADRWTLVFHTTPDSEPERMFASLQQVAQGSGQVERLDAPVERFTVRPEGGAEAAFLLEWGERRVRVPVRAVP